MFAPSAAEMYFAHRQTVNNQRFLAAAENMLAQQQAASAAVQAGRFAAAQAAFERSKPIDFLSSSISAPPPSTPPNWLTPIVLNAATDAGWTTRLDSQSRTEGAAHFLKTQLPMIPNDGGAFNPAAATSGEGSVGAGLGFGLYSPGVLGSAWRKFSTKEAADAAARLAQDIKDGTLKAATNFFRRYGRRFNKWSTEVMQKNWEPAGWGWPIPGNPLGRKPPWVR